MSSLPEEIDEIIEYAKGNSFPTSNLLKHALVVAKKIEDLEFEEFVTKELKGYSRGAVPSHRRIRGEVIILPAPYGTLQPVDIGNLNAEDTRKVSTAYVAETVPNIENTINFQGDQGVFTVGFSAENEGVLPPTLNEEYGILLLNMQLKELLDDVRTIILDWAVRRQREMVAAVSADSFSTTRQPATKENRIHASRLYEKVSSLIQNSHPLNENTARIIVESADDAIKEFGSTNQEKKVELRKWKCQAEQSLPPNTVEELRKRAEGKLLRKSWPRSPVLQKTLLGIVALVLVIGGFVYWEKTFSGDNNAGRVSPTETPLASPLPSITSTPGPKPSQEVARFDAQPNSSNSEARMPPLCIRYEESKSAFSGEVTLAMGGISYEGSPPRHFISFTVSSPGRKVIRYGHKENGEKITYIGLEAYEITVLSTDTLSACFDVRRTEKK